MTEEDKEALQADKQEIKTQANGDTKGSCGCGCMSTEAK